MSYEYDASYRIGMTRTADVTREVEARRRAAERSLFDGLVKPTKDVPFWVWFRSASVEGSRIQPASAF